MQHPTHLEIERGVVCHSTLCVVDGLVLVLTVDIILAMVMVRTEWLDEDF